MAKTFPAIIKKDDEIIYISSRIGWKWYIVKHVLIDISGGYNIVIDKSRYNPIK